MPVVAGRLVNYHFQLFFSDDIQKTNDIVFY